MPVSGAQVKNLGGAKRRWEGGRREVTVRALEVERRDRRQVHTRNF